MRPFLCHRRLLTQSTRLPKRKVALLVGYNGNGYQGMQFNPGIKSIEQDLFDAICKAGGVSEQNAVDPRKVQWFRAARTDKGVHAVGNVVSLKMIIEDPLVVEKINAHLPGQIRVWGYLETQGSFHAKMDCDSRRYEFLLPTYTLMPMAQWLGAPPGAARHAAKSTFRASRASLDAFSQAMRLFLGTHRFHNYTIRVKEHTNMSLKRYIKAIDVSDPIILQNGMEWVRIRLHGQSFMLHQIRKMIAMAILVIRSETSLCAIEQSLQADTCFNIPKAPALGLLLDRPVFDWYNQKIDSARRQPLDFDKHKGQMEAFKEQWIDQQIIQTEMDEGTFELFLDQFDAHRDHFTYLKSLDRV